MNFDFSEEQKLLQHTAKEFLAENSSLAHVREILEADAGYTVALDTRIDDALRLEGLARELVNRIQRLRRDTGLLVSDRIRARIHGDAQVAATVARR